MDEQREEELLLHVVAGTDLPTALAALPQDEQPASATNYLVAWAVFIAMLVAWWLLG